MKVRIKSDRRLSNRGFHRCGGSRSGAAHWWLRGEYGFVQLPKVRGDEYFDMEVDLAPGEYVLGTGRGRDAIRVRFVVREDGTVEAA